MGVRPAREQGVAGRTEAFDLADLGDHEHGRVAADPPQLAEDVDARVVAGERVDLALGLLDLAIEVADQAEQAPESPPRRLATGYLGEVASATLAEEVAVAVLDSPPGKQRVHPVLERRAHPGEHDPVAQQITQVAQVARGNVRPR